MIAIVVPVLGRPERAAPLVDSIRESSTLVDEVVFVCSPDDIEQQRAAARTVARVEVAPFSLSGGDYARKINHAVTVTKSPWIFQAGDDLAFHASWDVEAMQIAERSPGAGVIGTNDLGNPLVKSGAHSTHSLISRVYIEEHGTVDEPGKALHEGYWHCWVDNELIETAKARNAYFAARRSRVEHLHHIWHKGENDATYQRGQERYAQDYRLFVSRRALWRVPR